MKDEKKVKKEKKTKEVKETTKKSTKKDTKKVEPIKTDVLEKAKPLLVPIRNNEDMVIDHNILKRKVYIDGLAIENREVQKAIRQIIALDSALPGVPIILMINTYGGSVLEAMALVDVMKAVKSPIYTIAMGSCMSAGTYIHAHGEPGHRYIYESTEMLLHPMRTMLCGFHTMDEIDDAAKHHKRISDKLLRGFIKCGNPDKAKKIKDLLKKESFMDADVYIDLGLADHIMTPEKHAEISFMPKVYTEAYKNIFVGEYYSRDIKEAKEKRAKGSDKTKSKTKK